MLKFKKFIIPVILLFLVIFLLEVNLERISLSFRGEASHVQVLSTNYDPYKKSKITSHSKEGELYKYSSSVDTQYITKNNDHIYWSGSGGIASTNFSDNTVDNYFNYDFASGVTGDVYKMVFDDEGSVYFGVNGDADKSAICKTTATLEEIKCIEHGGYLIDYINIEDNKLYVMGLSSTPKIFIYDMNLNIINNIKLHNVEGETKYLNQDTIISKNENELVVQKLADNIVTSTDRYELTELQEIDNGARKVASSYTLHLYHIDNDFYIVNNDRLFIVENNDFENIQLLTEYDEYGYYYDNSFYFYKSDDLLTLTKYDVQTGKYSDLEVTPQKNKNNYYFWE